MSPAEDSGLLELWLLQLVWVFGPWLGVGLGLVLILRGSGAFKAAARRIEERAQQTAARGRPAILLDVLSHRILTLLSLAFAVATLALAGLGTGVLQGSVEPRVREIAPPVQAAPVEPISVDFIAAVCLATIGLALAIATWTYRVLRRRALEPARGPSAGGRPATWVGLFSRPLPVRLGVTAFATFVLCGILSHVVWGLLALFPPPAAWRTLEAPGLLSVLAGVLLCIGPAVLAAALAPTWSLEARHARLQQRFLELVPRLRLQVVRRFAMAAGLLGAAIDFVLLGWIATSLFPWAF